MMRALVPRRGWLICGLLFAMLRAAHAQEQDKQPTIRPRPAWVTSRVQGTPDPPEAFQLVPALAGLRFERPTCVAEAPGARRIFIGEIDGDIYSIRKNGDSPRPQLVLRLRDGLTGDADASRLSLFDFAFHPDFEQNRQLLVTYVYPGEGTRVSRLVVGHDDPPTAALDREEVILRWPSGGHNGGCLCFGPDGYLYIATGDGSGPHPPDALDAGQDLTNLFAAILRIDIDHAEAGRGYSLPADNPFLKTPGARPEIWAFGFRNPFKMAVDARSGAVWVGDNGWETWEMVHLARPGGNHGWPLREGPAVLRNDVDPGPGPIVPPVQVHRHPEFNSIIGGIVYRGTRHPELAGSFVYGDYFHGRIWGLHEDESSGYSASELLDTHLRPVCFAEGSDGEIFVLDHDVTGGLYEIRAAAPREASAPFPRKLSETGLFTSLADLQPAPGVVAYQLRVEPWTDGATAVRHIGLPGKAAAGLSRQGDLQSWEFPEGTVVAKTLMLDVGDDGGNLPVETQLLHLAAGTWRPYSYAWDEAGGEALLVDATGSDIAYGASRAADKQNADATTIGGHTWRIAGRSECRLCHHAATGPILGFVPRQLDVSLGKEPATYNQLDVLAAMKLIDAVPPREDKPPLVDPHDPSADLDDRVRSYLHVNCSMCHQPRGDSTVAIFLLRDYGLEQTKIFNRPGVGTFGIRDPRVVARGAPHRSVMLYRMSKVGYARMPMVGSRAVDPLGVALVHQWIALLGDTEATPNERLSEPHRRALELLRSGPSTRDEFRQAINQLLESTEGALELTHLMHRGAMDDHGMQLAIQQSREVSSTDIRGLFEAFIPEAQRPERLGPQPDAKAILAKQGDAARGKLIYLSDAARCHLCHVGQQAEDRVGPDLEALSVGKKYPRAELLKHILEPAAKVEADYAQYTLVTTSGQVHVGLLLERTESSLLLKTAARESIRVAAGEIESLTEMKGSLMPNLLLRDFTPQEAADLLAYLASLK